MPIMSIKKASSMTLPKEKKGIINKVSGSILSGKAELELLSKEKVVNWFQSFKYFVCKFKYVP